MADFSYDSYEGEAQPRVSAGRMRRWTQGTGAAVSVALVLGLVVWAWQIAVRDARGVPVIQAQDGPMRVAPEDPGGVKMAHQGLAVNSVAAVGEVADPADRLMLAPRPVELTDADQAGYAPIPASAVVPTLTPTIPAMAQAAEEGSSTSVLEGDAALIALEPEAMTTAPLATVPAATEPAAAVSAPEPLPQAEMEVATAVAAALADVAAADPAPVIAGTKAAVATSPRPMARPGRAAALPAEASDEAPAGATAETSAKLVALDGAAIAVGTRLVQLGAYDDEAAAMTDWQKLAALYEAYFKGKDPVIQKALSGGKTFYRLRALGFADEDEARRFCAVLLNDRAQCIPVRVR